MVLRRAASNRRLTWLHSKLDGPSARAARRRGAGRHIALRAYKSWGVEAPAFQRWRRFRHSVAGGRPASRVVLYAGRRACLREPCNAASAAHSDRVGAFWRLRECRRQRAEDVALLQGECRHIANGEYF